MSEVEKLIRNYIDETVLEKIFNIRHAFLSFSGGVDSTVVLVILAKLIGPDRVTAVTFDSFLNLSSERERARSICDDLGVNHLILSAPELKNEKVMQNHNDRCAICKELRIKELLKLEASYHDSVLVDGTNGDDLKDPTRLGNRVLARYTLFSPLAESSLSKDQVRSLARDLSISWWNESPTACIATRFPRNVYLDETRCHRVAMAEAALKRAGFKVRLRAIEDAVCLELDPTDEVELIIDRKKIKETLAPFSFSRIMVDIDGYSTGRSWP